MTVKAHHAVNALYSRYVYSCKRLRVNENELQKTSDAYFRHRELLHEQQKICDEVIKMFGVLGTHSPEISKELANTILSGVSAEMWASIYPNSSPPTDPFSVDSAKVRDSLKLWEILQVFLCAADNKATVADFRSFLFDLNLKEKGTPQAIESALKTHPELFEEVMENGQRLLILKQPAFWIRSWGAIMRSIRALVRDAKRKYGSDAERIEVIEVPARTVIVQLNQTPGAIVQASISLSGTRIEIKAQENRNLGKFPLPDQVIEVDPSGSSGVYTYDGQRLTSVDEVAEIILAPVLDYVRMA